MRMVLPHFGSGIAATQFDPGAPFFIQSPVVSHQSRERQQPRMSQSHGVWGESENPPQAEPEEGCLSGD